MPVASPTPNCRNNWDDEVRGTNMISAALAKGRLFQVNQGNACRDPGAIGETIGNPA